MLKLANSALKPPDPLAGGGEVGLQLLEYGAGMFGQVRQLSQGPRQSHVTDGDQILEKQALLVRDLIPAQQLGFHYSFGKRHVGSDRGINPTKSGSKVSRKQFSPLKPRSELSCCRLCRCPPSLQWSRRTVVLLAAAPGHLPSRARLRRVAPLGAPDWRWFLKNGRGEILERISGRPDRDSRPSLENKTG